MTSPDGNLLLTGQSLAVGMSSYLTAEAAEINLGTHTEAVNGYDYNQLKQGTVPYNAMVTWVTGHADDIVALHVVHGEGDMVDSTPRATYAGYLVDWITNYNTDLVAITGQLAGFPMIVCQVNSWEAYSEGEPTIGLAQLDAAIAEADIFLVGPKYQFGTIDGVHLSAANYENLAILHRRALDSIIATSDWEPVRPTGATLAGSVITVQFEVPTTPLQFDTSTVAAQTNQGFTVTSDSGSETITGVALGVDETSVEITLSGTPGTNLVVKYGFQSELGNLCDSETADGLANWCVHFDQAVT